VHHALPRGTGPRDAALRGRLRPGPAGVAGGADQGAGPGGEGRGVRSVSTVVTERETAAEQAPEAAKPGRARTRIRWRIHLVQVGLIVAILAAWELSAGRLVDDLLTSRPSEIFPTFWSWIVSGELLYHASSTFKDAFLGLLSGGAAGLVVGCVLGQSKRLAQVFEPFITA